MSSPLWPSLLSLSLPPPSSFHTAFIFIVALLRLRRVYFLIPAFFSQSCSQLVRDRGIREKPDALERCGANWMENRQASLETEHRLGSSTKYGGVIDNRFRVGWTRSGLFYAFIALLLLRERKIFYCGSCSSFFLCLLFPLCVLRFFFPAAATSLRRKTGTKETVRFVWSLLHVEHALLGTCGLRGLQKNKKNIHRLVWFNAAQSFLIVS